MIQALKSILLVVNDATDGLLIESAFSQAQADVDITLRHRLHQASKHLAMCSPNLVIADYQLTDGRGIELLPADQELMRFPLVILTDHGDQDIAVAALKSGAMDCIIKSPDSINSLPLLAIRVLREWQQRLDHREAIAARKRSEVRLASFFQAASEGIFFHQQGRILDVNGAIERLLGYTDREVIGRQLIEFIAQEDQGKVRQYMISGLEGPYEVQVRKRDGRTLPMEVRAKSIETTHGSCRVVSIQDISARKIAEKVRQHSEWRLQETQRIAHMGSWEWDLTTHRVHWENEVYRIFGYQPGEVDPTDDFFALHLDRADRNKVLNAARKAIRRRALEGIDFRIRTHHGERRHVHIEGEVQCADNGRPIRLVGSIQDITERKLAEIALQKARDELEHKVAERTLHLARANERLQELEKLKSLFIASMSHELRTPLNAIIGFTGILLQGLSGDINEQQKDQLQRIYSSAKHLLDLIVDVIDISKIEAGRMDTRISSFSIRNLLKEAVHQVQIPIQTKNLDLILKSPADIIVRTDRKRLLQCLVNVLSNAAKYTEQGKIEVYTHDRETSVEISVQDTGIGIDDDTMKKLFLPFERADSHLRINTPGTGLGLYLTKKLICDLLKGDIHVSSQPGKGSQFTLDFPKDLSMVDSHYSVPRVSEARVETIQS